MIECILGWANENGVTFAPKKTHLVCFGAPKSESITIETPLTTLQSKSAFTYLGVIFDSRLTFHDHLTKVHNNALSTLSSLRNLARSRLNISSSCFHTIFVGTILPKIFYAAPVWCTVAKGADGSIQPPKKLRRLTHSAARQITRCLPSTPISTLLGLAGLPDPSFLLAYQVALRMTALMRLPRSCFHLLPPTNSTNLVHPNRHGHPSLSPP